MKNSIIILFAMVFILSSCTQNSEKNQTQKSDVNKTEKLDYSKVLTKAQSIFKILDINQGFSHKSATKEQIELGQKLFFENKLSLDNSMSCNSCHNLNTFGVDKKATSTGVKGKNGNRNSPTVLNAALHISQFWDGRAKDVEEQAGGPILNPIEMAMPSEKAVVDKLSKDKLYIALFKDAYPDSKPSLTYKNLQDAIGSFERTLITPSKFDIFLAGDSTALNYLELKGLNTFIEVGCTACHNGIILGGNMYQKFATYGDYWDYTKSKNHDLGKFESTKEEGDKFIWKVPSLRNISKTGPYFHDGSISSLSDAIKIMGKAQLNKDLSDTEIQSIEEFLNSLTGHVVY